MQAADERHVCQRQLRTAAHTEDLEPRQVREDGAGGYSGRLQEQPLQTGAVSCMEVKQSKCSVQCCGLHGEGHC
jgi:hypothetical protein